VQPAPARLWIDDPPQTPRNASHLGPDTGQQLSTDVVAIGQPVSTVAG
jgi:hypothetical protein